MTEKRKVKIPTREEFHMRFGGNIYLSDFSLLRENDTTTSYVAARIEQDARWEKKLYEQAKRRKNV